MLFQGQHILRLHDVGLERAGRCCRGNIKGSFFAALFSFFFLFLHRSPSNKTDIPSLTYTNPNPNPFPTNTNYIPNTPNMPDNKMTQSDASRIQSSQVSPPHFHHHSSHLTTPPSPSTHATNIHHLPGDLRQRHRRWEFFLPCAVRWRQERQSSCWSCCWKHWCHFWWAGG